MLHPSESATGVRSSGQEPAGGRGIGVLLAQCRGGDAEASGVEVDRIGWHGVANPFLDSVDESCGGTPPSLAERGEAEDLPPAVRRVAAATDQPVLDQAADYLVRGLARDERSPGEIRVRGPRVAGKNLEAGVLGDGHSLGAHGVIHRPMQCVGSQFQGVSRPVPEVVKGLIQIAHVA